MENILPNSFYLGHDVLSIAQELLGCEMHICRQGQTENTIVRITETEAYRHYDDKACHAHLNRKTKRNQPMHMEGGRLYVYLTYGIHHMLNIVTNVAGKADAVLLRAVEPITDIPAMLARRNHPKLMKTTTAGPGNLTQALGIDKTYNTRLLQPNFVFIKKTEYRPDMRATTRIGIDYAGEDSLLPWRFYDRGSIFVSKL